MREDRSGSLVDVLVSADVWMLFQSVMVKNELRAKAKMLIYQMIFAPTGLWPQSVGRYEIMETSLFLRVSFRVQFLHNGVSPR